MPLFLEQVNKEWQSSSQRSHVLSSVQESSCSRKQQHRGTAASQKGTQITRRQDGVRPSTTI